MSGGHAPDTRFDLAGGQRIQLDRLQRVCAKPELFAPGEQPFWDHPHISRMMLKAHLDPCIDAASRRPEEIEAIVDNLVHSLGLNPGDEVLDLGCGPGLYCERLQERGLRVTGIDLSANSIRHARYRAAERGYDITYVHGSYLDMSFRGRYDAVFLIYGDLCALTDDERDRLLSLVRRALKPTGSFACDVTTVHHRRQSAVGKTWYAIESGFWRPGPHLVLQGSFEYPQEDVGVDQYMILDDSGEVCVYRVWQRYYSAESLTRTLCDHGFTVTQLWSNLAGEHHSEDGEWIGVVASPCSPAGEVGRPPR